MPCSSAAHWSSVAMRLFSALLNRSDPPSSVASDCFVVRRLMAAKENEDDSDDGGRERDVRIRPLPASALPRGNVAETRQILLPHHTIPISRH